MTSLEEEWADRPYLRQYIDDVKKVERKIRRDEREKVVLWLFRHQFVEASIALAGSVVHDIRTETEENIPKS